MFIPFISVGIIVAAASPSPVSNFFLSQLFGIIIGGVISAVVAFLGSWIIHKQQQQRDKDAYDRQMERDEKAYTQQVEREQAAYIRSLKDAKRERLHNSYRVLLEAADKYQFEMQQLNHLSGAANISLAEVDKTVIEIYLENVDSVVLSTFFELRGAFNAYCANLSMPDEGRWEEVIKHKNKVFEKFEELKTTMNKHLEELEQ